jgi:hypothetical protein
LIHWPAASNIPTRVASLRTSGGAMLEKLFADLFVLNLPVAEK